MLILLFASEATSVNAYLLLLNESHLQDDWSLNAQRR